MQIKKMVKTLSKKTNLKIVVPLKHLRNFWRTLDMPLINWEVSFTLPWSENCILTDITAQTADPNADPTISAINNSTNATFKITGKKLYVPVVTFQLKMIINSWNN